MKVIRIASDVSSAYSRPWWFNRIAGSLSRRLSANEFGMTP